MISLLLYSQHLSLNYELHLCKKNECEKSRPSHALMTVNTQKDKMMAGSTRNPVPYYLPMQVVKMLVTNQVF